MVKCTINGKEIEVGSGATIIEAFQEAGVDIAHYCWHPGLSVAGVCRMCMVSIEGNPRLQIACNTPVAEGMVISNQTDEVKEAVKWALDFHLINHPLDCPICDQAGECGLQNQYMKFGRYTPEMSEPKVKKRKVVDLGPRVVLDTERCILCSRCVRFTDEVSQTHELGIFNRGDRSEIGTFTDKPLDNNYSLNTVDICPVGALTSKDFRFRQRVWFLKDKDTVCPGCSTGCNVKAYFNKEGVFRFRPVYNEEVNGHWMCDKGRDVVHWQNRKDRLVEAYQIDQGKKEAFSPGKAIKAVGENLRSLIKEKGSDAVAAVVTAQYTSEELADFIKTLKSLGVKQIYYWVNNPEKFDEFDGLLFRGDQNPNTKGLLKILEAEGIASQWDEFSEKASNLECVLVAGPENQGAYPTLNEKVSQFAKAKQIVWFSANPVEALDSVEGSWQIPTKSFLEKKGTFVNHEGREQAISPVTTLVSQALTLSEVSVLLSGEELDLAGRPKAYRDRVHNEFVKTRGQL